MGSDISKLIEAINRVGIQNVSLLSRLTGMPKETIRYVLRKRFPQLGLRVGMVVNHQELGLEGSFAMLRFSNDMLDHASELLDRLAKTAFLTYRSALAFELRHIAMFAVPVSVSDQFQSFLKGMVREGILGDFRTERLEWMRHLELKSRYHDFGLRKWTVDWKKIGAHDEAPPAPLPVSEPSAKPDLDVIDTLIIKELESNSWRNFVDIARKLGLNDRTLLWHYRNHVSQMISSYYVRWLPVAADELANVIGLVSEFSGLSRNRLSKIRHLFNKFPFSWYEAGRSDGYYQVHSAIPAEYLIDSLRFLNKNLKDVVSDWSTHALDLSTCYSYTIPYENFHDERGWSFDQRKVLNSITLKRISAKNKNIGNGP